MENQEEHGEIREQIIAYMSGNDFLGEEREQRRRRYQAMIHVPVDGIDDDENRQAIVDVYYEDHLRFVYFLKGI